MVINSTCGEIDIKIALGHRSIKQNSIEFDQFRERLGCSDNAMTSVFWTLTLADRWKTLPAVVMLRKGNETFGALLLHGRKYKGVPIGIFSAGYLCGRGGVLGASRDHLDIIEHGTQALLRRKLAHTIVVSVLQPDLNDREIVGPEIAGPKRNGWPHGWQARESRSRLLLTGGMDGVAARFSPKMRRNFRYYRKRAETELGCTFHAQLTEAQAEAAVRTLHSTSARPIGLGSALQRHHALAAMPKSFAMGLMDAAGHWVSYIAGWRHGQDSVVEWQLNQVDSKGLSLSMAMRNFYLEHEIGQGLDCVVFLGETTPIWSRTCEPQICGDHLAMADGVLGFFVREIYRWLHPTGKIARLISMNSPTQSADLRST